MQPPQTLEAPPPFAVRPITLDEYQQLIETGFFGPEERVELIGGYVHPMTAKGPHHKLGLRRLTGRFYECAGDQVVIQVQDSILLPTSGSQPEPDLALLRVAPDDYLDRHPEPVDVLLLVEVADSTLEFDEKTKSTLYAAAGIGEYWIMNLVHRRLDVYRDPIVLTDRRAEYRTQLKFYPSDTVTPLHLPSCAIDVSSVLPRIA